MGREASESSVSAGTIKRVVETASDFIFLVDREHRFVYVNHTRPEFTKADVLGQLAEAFVDAADRDRVWDAIERVFRTRAPVSYEAAGPGAEPGVPQHYFTRLSWVPVEGGEPLVSLIASEITERKRADDAVRTERRFFEVMDRVNRILAQATSLDSAVDELLGEMLEIFECDRAWMIHPCDPSAAFFRVEMERTRPGWPGAATLKVDVPVTDLIRTVFDAALTDGRAHVFDYGRDPLDPDVAVKEQFDIRSQMIVALHPVARDAWCLGIHHCEEERTYTWERAVFEAIGRRLADALASLLMARDLQQSEDRFRALVEHAPEAIVIFDLDVGTFVQSNRKAQELFGYEEAGLLERGILAVSPEYQPCGARSAEVAARYLEEVARGGTPEFDWMHRDAQGRDLPCEVRLALLPHKGRRLIRGSMTDNRARKAAEEEHRRLEEQLAHAQKLEAIGQLTGGVAHDFNNLLTAILGNLSLLDRTLVDNEQARRFLEEAGGAATRAAALTQRLLAFSRKQALKPEVLDLNRLLDGMEGLLRRTLGETIEVDVLGGEDVWPCEADPSQLENAILNLAINARDAMPGGGTLIIEVGNARLDADACVESGGAAPGQYVELVVTDTGAGMPAELLARVFEPFFTTKGPGRGSGLGLSMVFGFVKQSGGHVRLFSEPGVGTSAKIYLPRSTSTPHVSTLTGPQIEEPMGAGEAILVVEDEASVRELAVTILGQLGYRVTAVEDAREALRCIEDGLRVDLLFTDVVLPGGINGAELAREACRMRPTLRVLFTSGYTEGAFGQSGRIDPRVELLEKPYTRSTLARGVYRVLRKET